MFEKNFGQKRRGSKKCALLRLISARYEGGCYWQRMIDNKVSQAFDSKQEAIMAKNTNQLRFF